MSRAYRIGSSSVSGAIAVVVTLVTCPESIERSRGLVWGTVADAIKRYKGSPGTERPGRRATANPRQAHEDRVHESTGLALVRISRPLAQVLDAQVGDLSYISDRRVWLGGLHSTHAIIGEVIDDGDEAFVELGPAAWGDVVVARRSEKPVALERLY